MLMLQDKLTFYELGRSLVLLIALAVLAVIVVALVRRFGIRNVGLSLAAVFFPLILFGALSFQSKRSPFAVASQEITTRLASEIAIQEREDPPPAWQIDLNAYSVDIYPTQPAAAASLGIHAAQLVEDVIREDMSAGREFSRATVANAILIKEQGHLQVAPSVLEHLVGDLRIQFPQANVLRFETFFSPIETLGDPKPVFVVVSANEKPGYGKGEFVLSIGNENQYRDLRVCYQASSWVNGYKSTDAIRFRSRELAASEEQAADQLYDQVARLLAREFRNTPHPKGLPNVFDAKAKIRDCLLENSVTDRFVQTLTTPEGDASHRMAVLLNASDVEQCFNQISAAPSGNASGSEIGTVLPYAGLMAFVVAAWFVLKQISKQLSESNVANLAQE